MSEANREIKTDNERKNDLTNEDEPFVDRGEESNTSFNQENEKTAAFRNTSSNAVKEQMEIYDEDKIINDEKNETENNIGIKSKHNNNHTEENSTTTDDDLVPDIKSSTLNGSSSSNVLEKNEAKNLVEASKSFDDSDHSDESEYEDTKSYFSDNEEPMILPTNVLSGFCHQKSEMEETFDEENEKEERKNHQHNFHIEGDAITVPINGRPGFQLGALYNAETDSISEFKLWESRTIDSVRESEYNIPSQTTIQKTQTVRNKSEMLGINPTSAILLWCHDNNDYLKLNTIAPDSVTASLYYEKVTRKDWLPIHFLQNNHFELCENMNMEDATHVVVELKYGNNSILELFEGYSSQTPESEVYENLKTRLLAIANNEKEEIQKETAIHYYESLLLINDVKTLKDAALLYQQLVNQELQEVSEPKQAILTPIRKFDSEKTRQATKMESFLHEKCLRKIDELTLIKAQLKAMTTSKACQYFPTVLKSCNLFLKLLYKHERSFKTDLTNIIAKLEFSDRNAGKMDELLKQIDKSPFSYLLMKTWIDNKQVEVKVLEELVDEICRNNGNVDIGELIHQKDDLHDVTNINFAIKIDYEDQFIDCMEKFLRKTLEEGSYISLKSPIVDKRESCCTVMAWFQNIVAVNFRNKNIQFLITEVDVTDIQNTFDVFNIVVKRNNSSFLLNEIIYKPIEIKVQILSHSICQLSWFQPKLSLLGIANYKLTLSKKKAAEENGFVPVAEALLRQAQYVLRNLLPSHQYQVQIIPCSKGYFLPTVTTVFETPEELNCLEIKTDKIGKTLIQFSWKNIYNSSTNQTGIAKYQVSLNKVSQAGRHDNVCIDAKDAKLNHFSQTIEGLKPNTRYQIIIQLIESQTVRIQSCQNFYTADKEVITNTHLAALWKILFSNCFKEAVKPEQLMTQVSRILQLKQSFGNLPNHKKRSFMLQLIASTEFILFIKKCAQVFVRINDDIDSAVGMKFKDLVSPLNIYNDESIDRELKIHLHFLIKLVSVKLNFHCNEIPRMALLFCDLHGMDNFSFEFSNIFTNFFRQEVKSYSELQQYILGLILQQYNIDENSFDLAETNVNIIHLLSDLLCFEEHIFQKSSSITLYQVGCIRYAMKFSDNKKEDFKKILSMFLESNTENIKHMQWFLSQWKESKLNDFLRILGTSKNFENFFARSEISEELVNTFNEIFEKKPLEKRPLKREFMVVDGEKVPNDLNEKSKEIFHKLKFHKYLEAFLSRQDVYCIQNKLDFETDPLPMKFLKNLLMLDYRCRSSSQRNDQSKGINVKNDDDYIFNAAFGTDNANSTANKVLSDAISNADIVLTAVVACDPFLMQDVFEKLAACQLAIPVILLNPKNSSIVYNLWALKSIKKKWKKGKCGKSMETNITTYPCKTISFCKIGQTSVSKSKVANTLLSTTQGRPEHSFYLNRDNDSQSQLNDGNIEVCWYTPEGSEKEKLDDLTCFYNLRGDVRRHSSRFQFLLNVSNIIVIFVGKESLSEFEKIQLKESKAQIILIQTEVGGREKVKSDNITLHFCQGKTISNVAECISISIDDDYKRDGSFNLISMEKHADIARQIGLAVDEDSHYCREGKSYAGQFIELIGSFKLDDMKRKIVPLQGENWKNWAEKDKEEFRHKFRSDASDPQTYSSELLEKKKYFRQQQVKSGPSKAIIKFIESLALLPRYSSKYFLHYVQMHLNHLSEKTLPKLLKDYNDLTYRLNNKKKELEKILKSGSEDYTKKKEITSSIENLTEKIKSFSKEFDAMSFGIEHIFREIAQIFESFSMVNTNIPELIDDLPKIMVELMLEGYPLEIMDGNVSHIPITWLEKVFLQLKRELKNAKIYVISVLGIQSSGKSTFLNTMHGCQFSVSSGRCTRGVFVQLVPVKKEFTKSLKCDYYLLMDTEGLRSPELGDSFHHDNEIATLISCLANLTIINFWGQTFSKDMSDVIQIAAYAYMRMNEVKIKSSFHMIFAGVQDVTAEEKNKLGVTKIMEEINEMVENVAKSQGRIDLCRGIRSIFPMLQESYEAITFPQFLPVLWHSSMSPPESRYGELINKLKFSIMQTLKDSEGYRHLQTIHEFLTRLKDIWRAIKMENFVFGFRNTQAIEVFTQMQMQYEEYLKELRELFFKLTWSHESEVNDLLASGTCNEQELVNFYKKSVEDNMLPTLDEQSKKINEKLQEYIAILPNPDHGQMHLATFEMHLKKTVNQLYDNNISRVEKNIKLQQESKKFGYEKQTKFKKTFFIEARNLSIEVRKMQDSSAFSPNEAIINNKFEGLFSEFLEEAKKQDYEMLNSQKNWNLWYKYINYLNEKVDLLNLKNRADYSNYLGYLLNSLGNVEEGRIMPQLQKSDVREKGIFNKAKKRFEKAIGVSDEQNIQAIEKLIFIEEKIRNSIAEALTAYLSCEEIVSTIMDIASKEIENEDDSWCFEKSFSMKIYANIYKYAIVELKKIEIEKMRQYSLETYFTKEKEAFRKMFIDDCTAANIEIRTIEKYCTSVLIPAIILRIKMRMGNEIYHTLSKLEIFSSKKRMFYEIEKDLLDQSASKIIEFSSSCEIYVKNWINATVARLCGKDNFLKNIVENKIVFEKLKILTTLQEVDDIIKLERFATKSWYDVLEEKLKAEPMPQSFKDENKELQELENGSFVINEMIRFLKEEVDARNIFLEIYETGKMASNVKDILAVLKWFDFDPLKTLAEERIGCTAQCPFCGVKCAADIQCIEGNRHKASMHRPRGLTGRHWEITRKLISEICTFAVGSDCRFHFSTSKKQKYNIQHDDWLPYKDVRKIVYDWDIPEIRDSESTIFWQYLFAKHQIKLAKELQAKPADIPKGWYNLTREEALRSLKQMHGINE